MTIESVYTDYRESETGLAYIIYETPLSMSMDSLLTNYPNGGFILYSDDEEIPGQIDVYLHAKNNPNLKLLIPRGYEYQLRKASEEDPDLDWDNLSKLNRKILTYVRKYDLDFRNLRIMSNEDFLENFIPEIVNSVKLVKKVHDIEDEDIRLLTKTDSCHKGIVYYGYYCGKFPERYERLRDDAMDTESLDTYLGIRRAMERVMSSDFGPDEENKDDGILEEFEGGATGTVSKRSGYTKTGISGEIGRWLEENSYNEFLERIRARVCGQEDLEIVLANIYNYLICMANGQKHNCNTIIAAPSGCGKTETFRAVRDYFEESLPKMVIYQIDMTTITEEGFKGNDTNAMVTPLLANAETNGMGIVFMDEFDKKLAPSYSSHGQNVNASVQNQILTLIEGRSVTDGTYCIDTNNTLFIGLGSFDEFRSKREEVHVTAGFDRTQEHMVSHYNPIERDNMIEHGASYELLGRFSSIVNYHELSYEAVEQIILIQLKKTVRSYCCSIELGSEMKAFLHENANSRYGCRMIESLIRESALEGYIRLLKEGRGMTGAKVIVKAPHDVSISLPDNAMWTENKKVDINNKQMLTDKRSA